MITWETNKPNGDTILAKLGDGWYPTYRVLYFHVQRKFYYDDCGDEVPYSAIKQWTSIESEKEK